MTILDRLKLELNNKQYFSDSEYNVFLQENDLTPTADYVKATHQRDLLYTVIDILESLANDTQLMQRVQTEFLTTSDAIKWLEKRIIAIKNRINALPVENEETSPFSLLFTRG